MKFYWSLHSLPEIATLPRDQRAEALNACRAGLSRVPAAVTAGLVTGLLMLGWFALEMRTVWWLPIIIAGVSGGVGGIVARQVQAHQLRPRLARYVKQVRNEA